MKQWLRKDGALGHFCRGTCCCKNWDHTLDRMRTAIISFLFARRPDVPPLSRWTKLRPALLTYLRVMIFNNFFASAFEDAFSDLEVELLGKVHNADEDAAAQATSEKAALDDNIFADVHFHASTGRRYRDASAFWTSESSTLKLFMFWLILDRIFWIGHWVLKRTEHKPKAKYFLQTPPIMDFLSPAHSPARASLQYFSALLACQVVGCSSSSSGSSSSSC